MRFSLLFLALLVAAAACLARGTDSTTAGRGSINADVFPAGPRSDWDRCWEALLTLGQCKHDLLASSFTGSPIPSACCHAADEVYHHCGALTSDLVGSLLAHGPLAQCARPAAVATGDVVTRPPKLGTGPRASGGAGARPPTVTSARSPPPRAPTGGASSGTQGTPVAEISYSFPEYDPPPPYPQAQAVPDLSPGTRGASPKAAGGGTRAPAVPGGARRDAGVARGAPTAPSPVRLPYGTPV